MRYILSIHVRSKVHIAYTSFWLTRSSCINLIRKIFSERLTVNSKLLMNCSSNLAITPKLGRPSALSFSWPNHMLPSTLRPWSLLALMFGMKLTKRKQHDILILTCSDNLMKICSSSNLKVMLFVFVCPPIRVPPSIQKKKKKRFSDTKPGIYTLLTLVCKVY